MKLIITNARSIVCVFFLVLSCMAPTHAQEVTYNLYVKSGILSVKVGTGQYSEKNIRSSQAPGQVRNIITATNGTDLLKRVQLTMNSGSGSSLLFELHDTLTSYQKPDGKGVFYRKATNENKRHDVETAVFSKTDDKDRKYIADLKSVQSDGKVLGTKRVEESREIFDLLSLITMLRSIDSSDRNFMSGKIMQVPMVNGLTTVDQYIRFEGRKKVKADNGKTYNCIEISIHDYKYGEKRETLRACVTDDSAHMPVQMDLVFSLGSIRCNLAEYRN